MSAAPGPRAVVLHPDALVRLGVRAALAAVGGTVIAELASTDDVLRRVTAADANVVIIDADVDGAGTGIALCAGLSEVAGAPPVVILVGRGGEADVAAAARAGAAGILSNRADADQFAAAVAEVAAGGSSVSADLSGLLLGAARREGRQQASSLSPRELEVLRLAGEGKSNRQIGEMLFLSEYTVKNHLARINEKLGASSRTEAVTRALRDGLIPLA